VSGIERPECEADKVCTQYGLGMSRVVSGLTPGLQGVHLKRYNFIFPKFTNSLSYTGRRSLHNKHPCLVFWRFWVEISSRISSVLIRACSGFPQLLQIISMIVDRISTSATSLHINFTNSLFIHRVILRRYTVRSDLLQRHEINARKK